MIANKRNTKDSWDPDTAPEIPDEAWERAQITVGGKVIREATGTLTKRGRPPIGDEPRQQVTLRLAPNVIRHFKQSGSGWQTRVNEVLERYVAQKPAIRSAHSIMSGLSTMARNEKTGKKAGRAASKVLRSKSTGQASKTAAGSALTQRPDKKKKR